MTVAARFVRRMGRVRRYWLLSMAVLLLPAMAGAQAVPSSLLNGADSSEVQQLLQQRQQADSAGQTLSPAVQMQAPTVLRPEGAPSATGVFIPQSHLEQIMSDRAGVKLRQFGYEQFGVGKSVTIPSAGAVAGNYVLGVGDQIIVNLRGQSNSEYRATIGRDGNVILPKLSPIAATGRTLDAFRADLDDAVHRAYVATQAYASVGQLRQVSVLVVGEVANPGTRIVTGLSTPVDAILLSGGIKKTGSLRRIEVIRGDKTFHIDLYGLLTQSGGAKTIALADGDRILVPPLGPTIAVTGWVRRPGIYEIPPGPSHMSVRQILALAGGTEIRDAYRLSLLRVTKSGEAQMETTSETAPVGDSDILYVNPAAAATLAKATLSGKTALAGRYPVTASTQLSGLLKAPGALGENPYTLIGLVSRRDSRTYLRKLTVFSPVAVLSGNADMALKADDVVQVFSMAEFAMLRKVVGAYADYERQKAEAARSPEAGTGESVNFFNGPSAAPPTPPALPPSSGMQAQANAQGEATLTAAAKLREGQSQIGGGGADDRDEAGEKPTAAFVKIAEGLDVEPTVLVNVLSDHIAQVEGAVAGPGPYFVGPQVSLADLVAAAGGTRNWADTSEVELTTTEVDEATAKSLTKRVMLPLGKGLSAQYTVSPHDVFRFRKVYTTLEAGQVALQGQVRFPGEYQITAGEHLSDLLARGGGLTNVAYPYGTIFLRKSEAAIEAQGYARIADEIENQLLFGMTKTTIGNTSQLSPEAFAALQGFVREVRNAKPLGRISITADPSRLQANPSLDVLLEPGDVIYIPQQPSTISVLGRVLQPGAFPFRPGASIQDYIDQAGGYAQFADDSATFIILPDGTAKRYSHSWFDFDQPSLPPGSAIVVPRNLAPLDLQSLLVSGTQILGQLATTAASLAVLSKQ